MQSLARVVAVVLGMHRAGTSLTAGILQVLGVRLSEDLLPATPDNPMGYFEDARIVQTHDALLSAMGRSWQTSSTVVPMPANWTALPEISALRDHLRDIVAAELKKTPGIWGFKDPRTPELLPLWQEIAADLGIELRYVIALRRPRDVVQSLRTRDGLDPVRGELLWCEHYLDAMRYTAGADRVIIDYDGWFERPAEQARAIQSALGLAPQDDEEIRGRVGALVGTDLRHHRSGDAGCVLPLVGQFYSALLRGDTATSEAARQMLGVCCAFARPAIASALGLASQVFEQQKRRITELEAAGTLLR